MRVYTPEKLIKRLEAENAFLRKELSRLRKNDPSVKWKPIPGYERYEASSEGDIRRAADMFGRPAGNVLKPKVGKWGHEAVTIYGSSRQEPYSSSVHRLVCMAFHGLPPFHGAVACHNNGDASDNRPENLRWATAQDNSDDAKKHKAMKAQMCEIRVERKSA